MFQFICDARRRGWWQGRRNVRSSPLNSADINIVIFVKACFCACQIITDFRAPPKTLKSSQHYSRISMYNSRYTVCYPITKPTMASPWRVRGDNTKCHIDFPFIVVKSSKGQCQGQGQSETGYCKTLVIGITVTDSIQSQGRAAKPRARQSQKLPIH